MNSNLIKELKHVKQCLVAVDLRGQDWEERQAALEKLEEVVTYLNDCAGKGIEFDDRS